MSNQHISGDISKCFNSHYDDWYSEQPNASVHRSVMEKCFRKWKIESSDTFNI